MLLDCTQSAVDKCREVGRHGFGRKRDGLSLLVARKPNGTLSRAFQQMVRRGDKVHTFGLGSADVVRLSEARARAAENVRRLAAGEMPLRRRDVSAPLVLSTSPMLRDVVQRYADSRDWDSRSVRLFVQRMALHVYPAMGGKPVDVIERRDVVDVLRGESLRDKLPTARKVLYGLGEVFDYAIGFGWVSVNVADKSVRSAAFGGRRHTTKHHAAVAAADLAGVLSACESRAVWPAAYAAVRFVALTLARSGEVRGAMWDEIDFDAATWTVPAARTKTRVAHRIPLSVCAVELLRKQAAFCDEIGSASGLVFPAERGKPMHAIILSRVLQGSGGTLHGLRSTFRTWAAERGVPHDVAESVLAHVRGNAVVAAYDRADFFAARVPLMEEWARVVCGDSL